MPNQEVIQLELEWKEGGPKYRVGDLLRNSQAPMTWEVKHVDLQSRMYFVTSIEFIRGYISFENQDNYERVQ